MRGSAKKEDTVVYKPGKLKPSSEKDTMLFLIATGLFLVILREEERDNGKAKG